MSSSFSSSILSSSSTNTTGSSEKEAQDIQSKRLKKPSRFALYNQKYSERILEQKSAERQKKNDKIQNKEKGGKTQRSERNEKNKKTTIINDRADKIQFTIPRKRFEKMVRTSSHENGYRYKFNRTAVEALHVEVESYMIELFRETNRIINARKGGELILKDLLLVVEKRRELISMVPNLKQKIEIQTAQTTKTTQTSKKRKNGKNGKNGKKRQSK